MRERIKPNVSSTILDSHKMESANMANGTYLPKVQMDFTHLTSQ